MLYGIEMVHCIATPSLRVGSMDPPLWTINSWNICIVLVWSSSCFRFCSESCFIHVFPASMLSRSVCLIFSRTSLTDSRHHPFSPSIFQNTNPSPSISLHSLWASFAFAACPWVTMYEFKFLEMNDRNCCVPSWEHAFVPRPQRISFDENSIAIGNLLILSGQVIMIRSESLKSQVNQRTSTCEMKMLLMSCSILCRSKETRS